MKSVDFPEARVALAKDQPQYSTLYCYVGPLPNVQYVCKLKLSDEEIDEIVRTRHLFYSQYTFGVSFQPMLIMAYSPFENSVKKFNPPMDENRVPAEEWDKSHFQSKEAVIYPGLGYGMTGKCTNCGKDEVEHYFSTRQCEL